MENGASTRGLLHRFELSGVEIADGQVPVTSAGSQHQNGSFAKPVDVLYKGLRCTGRRINQELAQKKDGASDDAAGLLLERYEAHCARLSELRHPHLVQFMGVFYETDRERDGGEDGDSANSIKQRLPVMVTEYLPTSLDAILQRYSTLPDELSYSILKDVSLGLTYLHGHSPPILHGELVASNVLLGLDMTAKLSNTGISSLLGVSLEQRRQLGRHTLVHLPPEMLSLQVESMTKKADSYGYGVLMIHALSGEFPEYLSRKAELVSKTGSVADMKGIDDLVSGINSDHPLSSLVQQCISRTSDLRPEASRIYSIISEMMLQFPVALFERRVEILQRVVKATKERKLSGQENTRQPISRKDSIANLANSLEIEHLKLQIEELHVENRGLRTSLSKQQGVVSARDHEMAAKLMAKDQEILAKQQELAALQSTIDSSQATISAKEATVHGLKNQLKHLQMYLATKHEVSGSTVYHAP
jgi:serine/threonine protein kinase